MEDAKAHDVEINEDMQAKIDAAKEEANAKVDEQLEELSHALDDAFAAILDFTSNPVDMDEVFHHDDDGSDHEGEGEPEPAVMLASEVAAEPETSNASYYGYGAAAFSAIAAAAYLYKKKQQAKGTSDEFQRVWAHQFIYLQFSSEASLTLKTESRGWLSPYASYLSFFRFEMKIWC